MNENKKFIVPAILTGLRFTKDGGLSISFATNEIDSAGKVDISALYNAFGWLVFQENSVDLNDIPKEDAEDKTKTPSKRLRATFFVLYKQKGIKQDFEAWYRESMEKIIEAVKNKLD